jgi:3-oxoacyl-[acyl-carrier protein] reductase
MNNILIVGTSSGIGLQLANQLSSGHKVYALSRTIGELKENENIRWKRFDVLEDDPDLTFLPEKLHGLVYCPGSIPLKPLRGIKAEEVVNEFRLNALGAFTVVQKLQSRLKASGNASVVFFSTVAVKTGMPYHASISMAKGAVEGLTRSLAAELAPIIRVNAIAPSLTDTPLASRLLNTEERKESSAQRHPLKRVGTAADIASMAAFLLSDNASWITGQILHVDGGIGALRI